ncbi:MAG: MipA/OmpV family protein [Caulobacteraceae bacterium]
MARRVHLLTTVSVGFMGALAAGAARAEGGWIVTVGGRLAAYRPYEGAGTDVVRPLPSLRIRRASAPYRFVPPDGGSSLALISSRYIVVGPMVRFRLARGDSGKLAGLDKVDFAAEPGAFVELWPTNWLRGRFEGRHGVFGHDAFIGDAALDLIPTGETWSASIGPRVGYGDANYFDTYFGVTPAEAARSPFIKTPYDPGGGRRYAGVEVAVGRHFGKRWQAIADVGYHRLAPSAANSPVVEIAGSPDDFSAGLSLTYSFTVFK